MVQIQASGRQQRALYAAYLRLQHELCVVIGGGPVAARKVGKLVVCDARVTVISPNLSPVLESLAAEHSITHIARTYQAGDLVGAKLVYAATNDGVVNAQVAADARALGIFANIVDNPDDCTLMVPAETVVGRLSVAVSTSGHDPRSAKQLAELLRNDLEHGTRTFQDAILHLTGLTQAEQSD